MKRRWTDHLITLGISAVACSTAHAATFTPGYSPVGIASAAVYNFIGTGTELVATFVGGSAHDKDILEISINGGAFIDFG
jgi:hypothetical protein